jgi:flavorubredoxin
MIQNELSAMKFDLVEPGVRIQYIPDQEASNLCFEYGQKIGQSVVGLQ